MTGDARRISLRDSTLREALDTPRVDFTIEQRVAIARALADAGVAEAEVVAPSRVEKDLAVVERLRASGVPLKMSGLIYAAGPACGAETEAAARALDHFDLIMPVAAERPPRDRNDKRRVLCEAVVRACTLYGDVGAGFPHAAQTEPAFLVDIAVAAVEAGARRLIVYDTNGSGNPFAIRELIAGLREHVPAVSIRFHGHNDLGLATANSLAAVLGGADGLDVTVNGLGDRAGNASLEQAALLLHLNGFETGIRLEKLRELSAFVAKESGVPVPALAPVVGEFALWHKSPSHLRVPGLFEAFDPGLILSDRKLDES